MASKYDIFHRGTKSCGCIRKDRMQRSPGQVSYSGLYDSCRQAAFLRGLEFKLTKDEHKSIISRDCVYCGEPPRLYNFYVKADGIRRRIAKVNRQQTIDRAWIVASGVDRINSAVGYTIANSVACCINCNRAKWEMSVTDFLRHAQKIVAFQSSSK